MIQPLVSICFLSYNHERYIAQALQGIFAQDYPRLEIVIADDASSDGSVAEIERALQSYSGPSPVSFVRNKRNKGLARTLNDVVARSTGEILAFAAADDVSLPDRISRTVDAFAESDAIHSVYGNGLVIDAEAREIRPFYPVPPDRARLTLEVGTREGFALMGASHAWRRSVFDVFGPLAEEAIVEDNPIAFRSAFLGGIRYIDRIIIHYRQHETNMFLGTMSAEASVAEWHRGVIRYLTHERAIFRARLPDLDVARAKFPARAHEVQSLREITLRLIMEREEQLRLLSGSSLLQRLTGLARMAGRGAGLRVVVRWFLTLVTPALYQRVIRWRAKRAVRR